MKDTKETIICPACGKEMKKIFSPENNFYIDICLDGCGGIYFDNQELKKFDEQNEDVAFILEQYKDKSFTRSATTLKRTCPNCSSVMVKNHTSLNKIVEIDECYSCGGIFLDYQELEKIRSEFSTEEGRKKDFAEKTRPIFEAEIEKEEQGSPFGNNYLYKKFFLKVFDTLYRL